MNFAIFLLSVIFMQSADEYSQSPAHYFADNGQQIIIMPERWVEKRRFAHMYQASRLTLENSQLTDNQLTTKTVGTLSSNIAIDTIY